jgi:phosphoenolpyruvate carboxykinase (ATP)
VPRAVPGIAETLLEPRRNWADPNAYDEAAEKLVGMFIRNFTKFGDDAGVGAGAGPMLAVAAE